MSDKIYLDNPYLDSKQLWGDVYGNLQTRLENAYRLILILAIIILVALYGLINLANRSTIKPFVAVVHGGDVLPVNTLDSREFAKIKPMMAEYFARRFITDARSVSLDGNLNIENQVTALSLSGLAASKQLRRYFSTHNPNYLARKALTQVRITSFLRKSANTLQIRWQEIKRDPNQGKTLSNTHFIAELTYQFDKPAKDRAVLRFNPLGFYITQLSWNKEREILI